MVGIVILTTSVLSSTTSAQNEFQTVRIGDYDCYQINGVNYTTIDDNEYIVISFNEANEVKDQNLIDYLNNKSSHTAQSDTLISTMSSTRGSSTFDLSNGSVYSGNANLKSGNSWTPTFTIGKNKVH